MQVHGARVYFKDLFLHGCKTCGQVDIVDLRTVTMGVLHPPGKTCWT